MDDPAFVARELEQSAADGSGGAGDEHMGSGPERHLVDGLLCGETRAGNCGGCGEGQACRQGNGRARGDNRVFSKRTGTCEVVVIGDACADRDVTDIFPDFFYFAGPVDAGNMRPRPGVMAPEYEFPVDGVETDRPVADEQFTAPGTRLWHFA